ncbi:LCP family protein [Synechococcus sp. CBW1108]|uniref:LCP family protein n=1 Tax=Synechococcus sp. CBW1108 TaxID=1353147 RepID=UPI0018CE6962|nr:LCP family protein [Synechococcus sp. CBW1108]QPN71343.1 LCP family protein [Synechococcus sp. CBW1108]
MSQVPLRQRRSDGDSSSPPGVTDLRSRRKSPQPAKPTVAAKRRRPPLVPFALGIALGYGLAGPLPQLATGAMAALLHGPQQLSALINPFASAKRRILVIGTDKVAENTDVMFTVQLKDGTTQLTQVPRDTFVESSEFGIVKANALYAFGGMDALKQEIANLLDAPVDRYVRVNLRAVEHLAAALGGVEVDVPKRMYYVDNAQNLYIDLYPGRQVLRGEQLEGFLRFRHDELGDLGRMERQKLVLAEVFRKLAQPATLNRLPELLKVAGNDIKTDLSPLELGQLVTAMASTKLSTGQLPGRLFWHNDLSYWMPDANSEYAGIASQEPEP